MAEPILWVLGRSTLEAGTKSSVLRGFEKFLFGFVGGRCGGLSGGERPGALQWLGRVTGLAGETKLCGGLSITGLVAEMTVVAVLFR